MDDLIEFLRARLDEDEEAARLAHTIDPAPWYEDVEYDGYTNQREGIHGSGLVRAADNVGLWDRESSCTLSMTAATTVHVARHDPARVLAEVEAKRRVVERYERALANCRAHKDDLSSAGAVLALLGCVKLLALPHAAHPGYLPEWAPTA